MGVSELFITIDPSHHEDQAIWRTYLMVYDTLGIRAPKPLYRLYTCIHLSYMYEIVEAFAKYLDFLCHMNSDLLDL